MLLHGVKTVRSVTASSAVVPVRVMVAWRNGWRNNGGYSMGILNNILGSFFQGTDAHPNLVAFLSWVQEEGGFPALLMRLKDLEAGGLTAKNLTPEHISSLFSTDELSSLAQHMGISQGEVTEWVSAHLLVVLQHLSPEAHQLGGSNMLDTALSILRERMK
jgi:uncharacterized protein YidB (DUF937 family)